MWPNFNSKAEEVTVVIEKVNSKKSARKNHQWRCRIKNVSVSDHDDLCRIWDNVDNRCPKWDVVPHDVNYIFNCIKNTTNLNAIDLWGRPVAFHPSCYQLKTAISACIPPTLPANCSCATATTATIKKTTTSSMIAAIASPLLKNQDQRNFGRNGIKQMTSHWLRQ